MNTEGNEKWVSVDTALPEKEGEYLVYYKDSKRMASAGYNGHGGWWTDYIVTHWREMPPPPDVKPYYYEIGAKVLMFWQDKWQNGKIIEGYRTRDGIINIQLENEKKLSIGDCADNRKRYIKPRMD